MLLEVENNRKIGDRGEYREENMFVLLQLYYRLIDYILG